MSAATQPVDVRRVLRLLSSERLEEFAQGFTTERIRSLAIAELVRREDAANAERV